VQNLRRKSKTTRETPQSAWTTFLEIAGLSHDGPLERLEGYIMGPRTVPAGEVLQYKGAAPHAVLFIMSGLLSVWNEGREHDQDTMRPRSSANDLELSRKGSVGSSGSFIDIAKLARMPTEEVWKHRGMLSVGTSRLLRIGPGWVLGCPVGAGSGIRAPTVPLTSVAETQVELLELTAKDARRLQSEDAQLALAINEVLAHFSALVLEQMSAQLSDWHQLAFSRRT